ncbi:MAG TPA: ATP-binding protein [Pseudonocardiaceae bacterium]|nr:ATP-binding protein [Pseudonocardiaceae bacterium]
MNPETTQIDDIRLVALPTAINCAELFVRFALTEWSLTAMLDEASDVARELTGAAVEVSDQKSPQFITVRARVHGDRLVVEVESKAKTRPPTNLNGPNGWRAGVVELRGGRSQLAWCELPLPGGMDASSVPLPRRHHRKAAPTPTTPDEVVTDLRHTSDVDEDVMRRILFGLGGTGQAE